MRCWGALALCAVLMGALLFVAHRRRAKDDAPRRHFVTVERGDIVSVVEAVGKVTPNREVEIKCKASGTATKVPVEIGDRVTTGDLLVELDPVDEERNFARLEAALKVAESNIRKTERNLPIARIRLEAERKRLEGELASVLAARDLAKAVRARTESLHAENIASAEELDARRAEHLQTEAAVEVTRALIRQLDAQEEELALREEEINVAHLQRDDARIARDEGRQRLLDTRVNSPLDGVVLERRIQEGMIVSSGITTVGGGTTVMRLADVDRLFVNADVDENDVGRLAPGQDAMVTVDAFPDSEFPARIERLAAEGVDKGGVVFFDLKVEVLGDGRALLRPGMTAKVRVTTGRAENVLRLPLSALLRKDGAWHVYLPGPGDTRTTREVKAGLAGDRHREILAGLDEGDAVLLPGDHWSNL